MERKMGCLTSPYDARDYRPAKATNYKLPQEFKLQIDNIKDQGEVNSCVAYALSVAIARNKDNFSTGWIYGYRPKGYYQGEGMYPREALKTLQKVGAVREEDFSLNIEMQEAKQAVDKELSQLKALARDFKIESYARLYSINEIKQWIFLHKTAVPICILTNNLDKSSQNVLYIPFDETDLSGHMMIIIGWNELGFIVQNSWGKEWGDNGTAILPYEYTIEEAWGITFNANEVYNSTKKPKLYWLRVLIQKIIALFR